MTKKPFSDRRWWGTADELTFIHKRKKPLMSDEELDAMLKEVKEYRIKHGLSLYGKPDYLEEENNNRPK